MDLPSNAMGLHSRGGFAGEYSRMRSERTCGRASACSLANTSERRSVVEVLRCPAEEERGNEMKSFTEV